MERTFGAAAYWQRPLFLQTSEQHSLSTVQSAFFGSHEQAKSSLQSSWSAQSVLPSQSLSMLSLQVRPEISDSGATPQSCGQTHASSVAGSQKKSPQSGGDMSLARQPNSKAFVLPPLMVSNCSQEQPPVSAMAMSLGTGPELVPMSKVVSLS